MPSSLGVSDFESRLPVWRAKKLERGYGITCPRCGGKAIVNAREWIASKPGFLGRSCTYCFRTNRIPDELK